MEFKAAKAVQPCRTCGFEMPVDRAFCDGCGAMAPTPRVYSLAPRFLMSTGGYSTGISPEFYGGGGFAATANDTDFDTDDDYTYTSAPRPYLWMGLALGVLVAMLAAGVWWWNRGADLTVAIAPANSAVTMDDIPLTMANGEVTLPAVKRGNHLLVVKVPDGGTLYRSVDVGFLATTQAVKIDLTKQAPPAHTAHLAPGRGPHSKTVATP
jgi:hypothetical protein